jgi:hypothetical protein
LLTVLTGVGWSLGVTSAHFQREELIILFLVVQLLLGLAVLGLRCLLDQQVGTFERFCPFNGNNDNLKKRASWSKKLFFHCLEAREVP